ncbi:MAG TPA: TlpA disulfide reductase family protein [Candidatus Acidoferrales bacterium]|nr:TlpA disulfide reductase family protein [Candidatus Acidoferrales bacterium]
MRGRRLAITLGVLAPLLGLLAYGFYRDPRYIPSPLLGKPAPDFRLVTFDGKEIRLAELRGQVVFLNFWSSWCPPCRAEAQDLEAAWRALKDDSVVFLGVAIQDRKENALAFLREFDVTYPNGMDTGDIAISFGVWGIPETFFINRDGVISYKHVGTLGPGLLAAKIDEAGRNIVSAREGKGSYQSIR